MSDDPSDITTLLVAWKEGDDEALKSLVSLVYPELRRIALDGSIAPLGSKYVITHSGGRRFDPDQFHHLQTELALTIERRSQSDQPTLH